MKTPIALRSFASPALAVMALASATVAPAQAPSCRVPADIPAARAEPAEQRRVVPIGAHTLALSWSPEYCRTRGTSERDRLQCGGGMGRFGFVLHGLWPDGAGSRWPQYCRPARALPDAVVRKHLCMTPSVTLLQHEWAKHGTCMTPGPEPYFDAAAILYRAIRYPDMNALSRRPLTARGFAEAFARANPGIAPTMLSIKANQRGWLQEVHVCLARNFRPQACPAHVRGAAPASELKIWRGRS